MQNLLKKVSENTESKEVLNDIDEFNSTVKIFYEACDKGEIEILDARAADDKETFRKKWKQKFHDKPIDEEITLYIGIKGRMGNFYEWYEEFFYPPKAGDEADVDRLLRELERQRK